MNVGAKADVGFHSSSLASVRYEVQADEEYDERVVEILLFSLLRSVSW